MQTMGTLIILFAFAIGTATFIENDFGPTGAKAVVYSATWFNILLILLAINLTGRILIEKMYKPKKFTIFLFHFAFLVILIGAGITRFISYEGVMHIREGGISNSILSEKTYVDIDAVAGDETKSSSKSVLMSALTPGAYGESISISGKKFKFSSVKYIPNAREVITDSGNGGDPYIIFVLSDLNGRKNHSLKYGDNIKLGSSMLNFDDEFAPNAVNVKIEDGNLMIFTSELMTTLSMTTSMTDTLAMETWHPFETRKLYSIGENRVVLTNYYQHGTMDYVPYDGNGNMMNALILEGKSGDQTKRIVLRGGKGYQGQDNYFEFNGVNFKMAYGAKEIVLPFSIKLKDFQLERYPGSNSPSSYASDVVVVDNLNDKVFDYRIFMNNVLNYGGYRFFQSSYDQDELGTILSVAHDYWGTFFSYLGYLLMSIGMFLSIFNKNTRFALVARLIKESSNGSKTLKTALVLLSFATITAASAQNTNTPVSSLPQVSKEQAAKFGALMVQSNDGRFKPVNTLSGEVLRKISRKSKLEGLNSDQVMFGMMVNPVAWQRVQMIKVSHPEVKALIGIDGKLASYLDFINLSQGTYKLSNQVTAAYEKKPAQRSKFDNELIKVDERLNICYMVYSGDMFRVLPDPTNPNKSWYSPVSKFENLPQEDSMFLATIVPSMLTAVSDNDNALAMQLLQGIADFQDKFGASVLPAKGKVDFEIRYNKMQIFDNLSKLYGILGVFMIILLFVEMFKQSKGLKYVINFFIVLVVIGFVFQTLGLGMRWYISGHAPWSDGYESMIYIAWVTLLAGLIFAHGSKMTIAATTFLSSIILMVAHLSWMDPEVTNLVPVLKSYWLTIHVSIITASYGFLALCTLLGLMNLVLMILKTHKNKDRMDMKINELTAISERAMTIGLYMLVIGTFLGGVWANESWGRYWGWDPKETWALVSVLVYSYIVHMHYMPGMKGKFAFNFAALISFSVILMTYFGVNYYLSGLHSYAAGDPVPVPTFVYYSIAVVAVVSLWAYYKDRQMRVK